MSFGNEERKKPAIDMNGFRRDLRLMWKMMQFKYVNADSLWKRDSTGRMVFNRVPFPEMKLVRLKREEDAGN